MSDSPAVILYDADGHAAGLVLDGSVYRLLTEAKLATGHGLATEATLAEVKAKTDNLDVALSTRTKPSDLQKAVLHDSSDNAVSVALDGTKFRVLTNAKIARASDSTYINPATQETLESIKDTDGVKKITDPVKAEGRAADGSPPVGNPVLVAGADGTNAQTILTDTEGRIVVVNAGSTALRRGFAFGRAVLSSTAVVELTETAYTEQASAAQRSIVSASANDTAAGTGARTVRITYFDNTMAGPYTETVTLNGTTAVNTVATNIRFVEKMEVLTAGSGNVNAGIISLKATTGGGGATVWSIATGSNQTFSASNHHVAAGRTCFITGFMGGIKGADTSGFLIKAAYPLTANSTELQISDQLRAPSSGQNLRMYGTPIVVVGPARIKLYAAPDSTSSRTYYGSFDYYEEET